jgi:CDP-diacylglycerol---serine O-phosphatidyltransferase
VGLGVKKRSLGGAIYVLPNLLTTGNLFFGFFSIVKSLQGDFQWAASAILLAAIFDMLDGRVARLTGGTSEFGVQYDSLCDLVSFGAAPALLMYEYGLGDLGRIGWIFCFFFLACGAMRLARFNVISSIGQPYDDFMGLPIPMSAAVISTFVGTGMAAKSFDSEIPFFLQSVFEKFQDPDLRVGFMAVMAPFLSLLMVSNVKYRSHKQFKISGIKPFQLLVIAVVLASAVAYQPELGGFLLVFVYAISGPLEWALGWKKAVDEADVFEQIPDESDVGDSRNSSSPKTKQDTDKGSMS